MSNINSIFSSISFLVILFLVFFISFIGFTKYQEASYSLDLNLANNINIQDKFKTFLFSYDSYSKNNFLKNIYYGFMYNKSYNSKYGKINLTSSIEKQLNFYYGKNNYYLNSRLKISSVTINLLYDDGKFMKKLSSKYDFKSHIENLNSNLNLNYKDFVTLKVYLLSNNNSACDVYDQISGIICTVITPNDLYISSSSYDPYFSDPYIKNYPNNEINLSGNKEIYTKNDWATFISKVSELNVNRGSLSNLNIIMFFTDMVNLGGVDDTFFLQNYEPRYDICLKSNNQPINSFSDCDSYACENCVKYRVYNGTKARHDFNYYCIKNDNLTVSNYAVNRSIDLLKTNKDIVFPIYIPNFNFIEHPSVFNYMSHSPYSYYSSKPELNPPSNTSTMCGKEDCEGCFENFTNTIFHPETIQTHLNQLSWITSNTSGEIINFLSNPNLFNIINNTISNTLKRYNLNFGIKQRNPINKIRYDSLYTINGESVPIIFDLEVYDNPYNFTGDLNFKPVINNHYIVGSDFFIEISHNLPIEQLNLSSHESTLSQITTDEENSVYKYIAKLNYIPQFPNQELIFYKDLNGVQNITFN